MKGIFVCFSTNKQYIDCVEDGETIHECLQRCYNGNLHNCDCYLTCNGKLIEFSDQIEDGKTYHVVPRLVGGKGGFGSMLRAIGAQIEKTTNREACRDLSGRRMRDVNNEKKLREWVSKAADREKEKEQRRKDRWDRMRAVPKHKFEDPEYHAQKQKVLEDMEESVQAGLQKAVGGEGPSTSGASTSGQCVLGKRKAPSAAAGSAKRSMNWIGVDLEGASDLSSDDSEDENSQSSSASDRLRTDSSNENSCSNDNSSNDNTSVKMCSNENADDAQPGCSSAEKTEDMERESNADQADLKESNSSEGKKEDESNSETSKQESKTGLLSALSEVPPKDEKEQQKKSDVIEHQDLDLMEYEGVAELEALGLEILKADLMKRGLKCGGTLTQRAERLFSVRGLTPDQYPANLKAKPAKK